jgi:hypothetical protein
MQWPSYTLSKNKKISPLLQATRSRWEKRTQQMFSSELMRVSVPAEDGSHQSSTFTHAPIGPKPKYPTHAYTKHKQGNKL